MERHEKLRKLDAFRRSMPHCTASSLAAILAAVKEHGVPEGCIDRNSFRQARNQLSEDPTPFGQILQYVSLHPKEGDELVRIAVAHPLALLWKSANECGHFKQYLRKRLREVPSSFERPWKLVIYSDEVTPGNPLATNNKRKFQAIYWSFMELGITALSREEAWFCVCTEYSNKVASASAGLSQLFGAIVKLFFDAAGTDMSSTGIQLDFGYETVRLWAVVGGVIQDGGAHKSVWHSRGDGASKFCLICKNMFTETSRLTDEDGSNLLI